jgi:hypothetical protein
MINQALLFRRRILPAAPVFVFIFQRAISSTEVEVGEIEYHLF